MTRHLTMLSMGDSDDEKLPKNPDDEALWQNAESEHSIERATDQFLHLPWPALDYVVGGIAPGEVWFVGAYSGHGKTTLLMSALNLWFEQGKRIFYMGLESKPSVLRTQWACQRLGINAGDVLSGALSGRDDWRFTRQTIIAELAKQTQGDVPEQVYFSPQKFVDAKELRKAAIQAHALKSDVLIIDHVDHLQGSGRDLHASSVGMMKTLLTLAQEFGLKVMAATQFNNEMIRGNRLGMHMAPAPTAVYQGGHKRQIASGMLGLYRPLRFDGLTPETLKQFTQGKLEPQQVIEPNVMAVSVMKHRLYGNREGKRIFLRVEKGRVTDLPERDLHRTRDDDGFRKDP